MRKLFSIFAAMLIALAVNADTDFAAPGYACAADDASLTGGSSSNFFLDVSLDPHQITWSDVSLSSNALATWTITATRGCYVTASLDLGPVISSNKHIFEVKILDDKSIVKGTLAEPKENADADQVKVLEGTILLPKAGVYTVELRNNRDWGKGHIKNVILTYAADAPSEVIEVSKVEINKTELALDLEEVELLSATVSPDNATDPSVTWETTDAQVATVSENGLVTAIAAGSATITAKAGEKSATCAVTVAAAAIPDVDFANPYVLAGKVAHLDGAIWKNEAYKLYGDGGHNKNYGSALWTINVTKPCIVSAMLNGVEGGHLFELDLYKGEELVATLAQPDGKTWSAGEIALEGTLTFAAKGNYTLKLRNTQEWSSGKVASVTLTSVIDLSHTYTVAGSSTDLFGTAWSPDNEANDMALQDDGTYKWEKTELTLAACAIEFKVCEDHAWTNCWPSQNYVLNIAEAGIYTITITFEPANENKVDAVATKTGSAEVLPTIAMHGNFLGSWADTQNFTEAEDKATASLKLTIAAGNYEFGMRIGGSGNWTSNGVAFSRENNSAKIVAGQGNLTLAADAAGDYIFTWTYETETLEITFPEPEPELPYMAIIGDMNNWAGDELVPAEDKLTASATIHLDMNANSGYGFKVLIGDKAYCIEPSGEWYSFHRGWTSASGIDHVATDDEAFWLSIDKAGDYTFTWTIAEKKLDITFPELLNITYYFVNTPDWEKVYAYAWSPAIADWPGEEATLQLGVSKNGHNVWAYTMPENRRNIVFNDGTGGEGHQTDDLTVEDGKPYFYDGVWYETLDDIATSISDTEAKTSVQKMIENGQIVIIRNGEKFNAQGQVIR